MKKNSPTEVGRSAKQSSDQHIDAINQVFALLELNYHNQFFKAYQSEKNLITIKRLWLDTLQRFSPEVILRGIRAVMESSEYLPTLRTMIRACQQFAQSDLPDPHQAYLEACQAPSPKAEYRWSHLAVYYAGKASDWFFLQSSPEVVASPVFKKHYEEILERVKAGEKLANPMPPKLAQHTQKPPLNKQQNLNNLARLKSLFDG